MFVGGRLIVRPRSLIAYRTHGARVHNFYTGGLDRCRRHNYYFLSRAVLYRLYRHLSHTRNFVTFACPIERHKISVLAECPGQMHIKYYKRKPFGVARDLDKSFIQFSCLPMALTWSVIIA